MTDLNWARVDAACQAIRDAIANQTGDPHLASIADLTEAEQDRASKMVALELTLGDGEAGVYSAEWDSETPPDLADQFRQLDEQ